MQNSSRQTDPTTAKSSATWAVITGASSGIGLAIARELAARGKHLVLAARRGDLLTDLRQALTTAHGIEVRTVAADLGTPAGCEQLQQAAADLDVDLLVCSAGFGTAGDFLASDLAGQLAMVDLNCRGLMQLSWHFGRAFVQRGSGGIVLFSSVVAFQGGPTATNYAATKAYVQSFAEGLHHELAPHGVAVLASAPGPVHTGFAHRAHMRMGKALDATTVARVTLAALGKRCTVRPGWLSKLLGWSLGTLPRWARVRLMHRILGGMVDPA